ncbi:MAG: HAD family hydrolase [Candidatus Kariarchaeaceae archaeon]
MASSWKSLIFDFDNTLIASSIDFRGLKQEIIVLLHQNDLSHDISVSDNPPLSKLAQIPLDLGLTELNHQMWELIEIYEVEGMKDAILEENVSEVLLKLAQTYELSILTNNTAKLTLNTLQRYNLMDYFTIIVSRDDNRPLKPSPEGLHFLINKMNYDPAKTLFIGDSPIDAIAAEKANISFLAYKPKLEYFIERGVELSNVINNFNELENWLLNANS